MRKTREEIEQELVSQFKKKVKEALDWQEEHPEYRLIELEAYLLEVGRELTGKLAEGIIEQKESRQPLVAPECKQCKRRMNHKGVKGKQVVTLIGDIEIERTHYWCPQCQTGFFPPGSRVGDMERRME